jgi:hypothetical protein
MIVKNPGYGGVTLERAGGHPEAARAGGKIFVQTAFNSIYGGNDGVAECTVRASAVHLDHPRRFALKVAGKHIT